MSHTDRCPSPWDARREGERAGERGYGSNPYSDAPWNQQRCEEAETAWRRGYDAGEERREEEEREQRAAERRRTERREQEEYDYYAQAEAERYAQYEAEAEGDPVRVEDPADSDPSWAERRADNN